MNTVENKICERCNTLFTCHAKQSFCNCFKIHLTNKVRNYITNHFKDCFCVSCLKELQLKLSSK